jgi:O-antigen ligase/polysaccharide polymerase Wzy-like membrane protein
MRVGRVRTIALLGASLVLLAGATVLAFFSGGYFDAARAWAGAVAWALVIVSLLVCRHPLPRTAAARVAIAGLALLAVWTLISSGWAPTAGGADHAGQIVALYTGVLLAATALLREPRVQRAVEPVLAGGTLIVIGYGLSERLLPGLLHFQRSITSEGRLEQPLTYWNAMGEVAALGLVLAARIAGDATRPRRLRLAAAAGSAPLGMGLYLTFSRGALFACAAGLLTLALAAPKQGQLRSIGLAVAAAALASLAAAPFRGLTALAGTAATRERQGAITLVALLVIMSLAALAQWALIRRDSGDELRLPKRAPAIALAVICAGFALAVAVGAKETSALPLSGATRYETLESNRYAYWKVALRAFGDEPLRGVGAGGWAVYWLRYRTIDEGAQDAHSLPLQTMAELGLVGLALLLAFIGGVAVAAHEAHRRSPALAAGPIAGFAAYIAHAPLDWDWEMPAVTVIALVLAGLLLALADSRPRP